MPQCSIDPDLRRTPSSGNVFADLGLPNPEERLLKADIAMQIDAIITDRGLTQEQAAQITGLPQSNISQILNGHLRGYSVERLLGVVNKLGRHVEVRISPRQSPTPAGTVVTVAGR